MLHCCIFHDFLLPLRLDIESPLCTIPTCVDEGRMLDLLSIHGELSAICGIVATAIWFIYRFPPKQPGSHLE